MEHSAHIPEPDTNVSGEISSQYRVKSRIGHDPTKCLQRRSTQSVIREAEQNAPETSNCVAHTPPCAFANAAPALFVFVSRTVQPVPSVQLGLLLVPVCWLLDALVQPFSA